MKKLKLLRIATGIALLLGVLVGLVTSVSAVSADSSSSPYVECIFDSDGKDPSTLGYILIRYPDGTVKPVWDKCSEYYPKKVAIDMFCHELPDGRVIPAEFHASCVKRGAECQDGRCVIPGPTPPEPMPEPKHQIWSFRSDYDGLWQLIYFAGDQPVLVDEGEPEPCNDMPKLYCGLVITGPDPRGLWIVLHSEDRRYTGYWRPGMDWSRNPHELGLPRLWPL